MWPDRVSNPGPPPYESGALPIALRGPAGMMSQYDLMIDLKIKVGHCDLYFMVQ